MERPERKHRIGRIVLYAVSGTLLLGLLIGVTGKVLSDGESDRIVNAFSGRALFLQATPTPLSINITSAPTEGSTETPIPTPTASPTPTPEPTPEPTRHPQNGDAFLIGDEAPVVIDIGVRLMVLDYMEFDQPTEEYTDGISHAVSLFQARNALTATGICDRETYEVLMSDDALTYAIAKGATGDEVEIIKERLMELGYLDTVTDFVYDEQTEQAVSLFRTRNGLSDDVIIDNESFEILLGEDTIANFYTIGDQSDEIQRYQEMLYKKGYLTYAPDGVFGKQTQNAVRRFQEHNGLVVDGCLGRSTKALLESGDGEKFDFEKGMEGDDVRRIQERLCHYGYLKESQITGYYGEKTEAAVRSFQSRNSVPSDGKVGYNTLNKLNSSNAKKAKTTSSSSGSSGSSSSQSGSDKGDTGTASGSTIDYGEGIEAFIKVAKSKLGCKYVRGAKGPNKFDCSGFVYWCLNQVGVKQSYMTSIAWRTCSKYRRITSMSDIKRGDVLVFKGSSMSKGHVGIYLGNGEMIDASSTKGKVRITDSVLSGSYWKNHFLMAYRIWD